MANYKFEEFKNYIKGRKAAVIGIGISNTPLIKWLISLGADVTACDKMTEEDPVLSKNIAALKEISTDIKWSLGESYLTHLRDEHYDIVFKTPKMRFETPELQALSRQHGQGAEFRYYRRSIPCSLPALISQQLVLW